MVYLVWALSGEGRADLADKDSAYREKMAIIDAALARCDADNPAFWHIYEDEVDIDSLIPNWGPD